jgi:hypothetical protein
MYARHWVAARQLGWRPVQACAVHAVHQWPTQANSIRQASAASLEWDVVRVLPREWRLATFPVRMECRADLGPGAGACIGVRIGVSVRDLALPLEEGGAERSGPAFWLFIGDMWLVCDCNTGSERKVERRKSDKAWDWIKGH